MNFSRILRISFQAQVFWYLLIVFVISSRLRADVTMPAVFDDHMVLQRDRPVRIWGWAGKGEKVSVTFAGQTRDSITDDDGNWTVMLQSMGANKKPRKLTVSGENLIVFEDILIGDVWLCAGQSNMANVAGSRKAELPGIRLFHMTPENSLSECNDFMEGNWSACNIASIRHPHNVQTFSHLGLEFGKGLHRELDIPIGLICNARGGSIIESWSRLSDLKSIPNYQAEIKKLDDLKKRNTIFEVGKKDRLEKVWQRLFPGENNSSGIKNQWHAESYDDSSWGDINFTDKYINDYPKTTGPDWLRKRITIPESWIGKDIEFSLGRIAQTYDVYFNGVSVGGTGNQIYQGWQRPYVGKIPKDLIKQGTAQIAIHSLAHKWNIGSALDLKKMGPKIESDIDDVVSLGGAWKHKIESDRTEEETKLLMDDLKRNSGNLFNSNMISYRYNRLVSPVAKFSARGVVWYQGESNAIRASEYKRLLSEMIQGWRDASQQDLPFIIVQLPNYDTGTANWCKGPWYQLREAQLQTLELPETSLVVTIDIGNSNNVHPGNKPAVASRLVKAALGSVYKKDVVYSGPIYQSMEIKGGKISLQFSHHGTGLMARGGELKRFEIAADNKEFFEAAAVIAGGEIIVSSPSVKSPVAVRYAWANDPAGCNLYNKEGLPASPFRTDNWATD